LEQQHLIQKEAAVVLKNLNNFQLSGLTITWPGSAVPTNWQIPVRLINGDFNLKFEHDYTSPRQTELMVIYGENLQGGMLNNPLAESSAGKLQKYKLLDSSIKKIE
jgi:hypothetical protein